jgi:ATP-dependent RNA helicase DeaD
LLWERPKRSLMFCHTRLEAIEITQKLQDEGFNASALHGDMTQRERNAVLASFKSGSMPYLVATNVAARGLDVEGVTHVIQLGLPDDKETFVHRSGRTGRAGNEGVNLILLSPLEAGRFKMMLRSTQMKVEWQDVPGLDLIRTVQREVAEEKLLTSQTDSDHTAHVEWASDLLVRADAKILVAKLLEAPERRPRSRTGTASARRCEAGTYGARKRETFRRFPAEGNYDASSQQSGRNQRCRTHSKRFVLRVESRAL